MPQTASTDFYITGGTLPPDAPSYVTRYADQELLDALKQSEYCYVLNSRQMGKSSLMARTAASLRQSGASVLILDLQKYGSNLTAVQWYRGMLQDIVEWLNLSDAAVGYWEAHRDIGPLNRFLNILRDYILPALHSPLVIFIDEIDYVRSLPFSTDEFFAGIRDCYNRRVEDARYLRLTFCLLGVAIPADLICDPRTTPFNIGRRIELQDFTPEEAAPLAEGLVSRKHAATQREEVETGSHKDTTARSEKREVGQPANGISEDRTSKIENRKLLDRVLYWTGGHPFLTQRLCSLISQDGAVETQSDVDRVCEEFFLSRKGQKTDDNLIFVRNRIISPAGDQIGLLELYRRVWENRSVRDDDTTPLVSHLRLSGIVRSENGRLVVRNRIYRKVFDRQWILDHLPDAEILRQRAAYRKGVLRTLLVAGVIILAMAGLSVFALLKADEANQKKNALAYANTDLSLQTAAKDRAIAEKDSAFQGLQQEKTAKDSAYRKLETQQAALQKANTGKDRANRALEQAVINLKKTRNLLVNSTADAQTHAVNEKSQRQRAEVSLYPNYTAYASRALDYEDDLKTANDVLDLSAPRLRGFVWNYLKRSARVNSFKSIPIQLHKQAAAGMQEDVIRSLTWSQDHRKLACIEKNHSLTLLKPETGEKIAELSHNGLVTTAAFAERGRLLAAGGNGTVTLWDTETRKPRYTLSNLYPSLNQPGDSKYWVLSTVFSPDEKWLAIGLRHGFIRLWNKEANELVETSIRDSDYDMACLAFSPDGRILARGSQWTSGKDAVRLWDPATGKSLCSLDLNKGTEITSLAFSSDGNCLLAGSKDGTLYAWSVSHILAGQTQAAAVKEHNDSITSIVFTGDSRRAVTAGADSMIKVWDISGVQTSRPPVFISTLRGHTLPVTGLTLLTDGKTLVSGGQDWTIRCWKLNEVPAPLKAYRPDANLDGTHLSMTYSRNGLRFLTSNERDEIVVWDAQTLSPVNRFAVPGAGDMHAVLSPDGKRAAVSYMTLNAERTAQLPKLLLWDVQRDEIVGEFTDALEGLERPDGINCLTFSPDGKMIATGARDPVDEKNRSQFSFHICLWDVASRKAVCAFPAHIGWVCCLAFTPDGRTLLSGGSEGSLRFWDVARRKELFSIAQAHTSYLFRAAFSPHGDWIASSGADKAVRLWRWDNIRRRIVGAPHKLRYSAQIGSLAFSSDDSILATGDTDSVLKLWSLRTGTQYFPEEMTKNMTNLGMKALTNLAFSPNGHSLAVGGYTGQILFLDASPPGSSPGAPVPKDQQISANR